MCRDQNETSHSKDPLSLGNTQSGLVLTFQFQIGEAKKHRLPFRVGRLFQLRSNPQRMPLKP